eukprot:139184-Pyramimonas_sp.AAC.1
MADLNDVIPLIQLMQTGSEQEKETALNALAGLAIDHQQVCEVYASHPRGCRIAYHPYRLPTLCHRARYSNHGRVLCGSHQNLTDGIKTATLSRRR